MSEDKRIPVIVGVGQVNDRPEDAARGLDSLQLMAAAARAADADGGGGWLARLDWIGIVRQLSFPALDLVIPERLPGLLGAAPRHVEQSASPSGDSPVRLLNDAANAIGAGEAQVALVVGGEALRTGAQRGEGGGLGRSAPAGDPPLHTKYGLTKPVDIYPLYENALRAAERLGFAEAQAESALIWSAMSRVAADNPAAWLARAHSAEVIATPAPGNRLVAFPYTKLMVANAAVNQGAALIVASLAAARAAAVPAHRLVYLGPGAAAHEAGDPLARARWDMSPGMTVSLRRTLALNAIAPGDLDHVELYSCFPCVPKMARRVLGLPVDHAMTVYGGLTFGGGPIGNAMSHAAASMVARLRARGGDGLLYANGGYATHNHSIVLTSRPQPAGRFPQDYDAQAEADALRGPIPELTDWYDGPAVLETYSIGYDRDGAPAKGAVLAQLPDGGRAIAAIDPGDGATLAALTGGPEPIGRRGTIARRGDLAVWQQDA